MPLKKLTLANGDTMVYYIPTPAPAEAALTWVLVHGAGGMRLNWENQLPALEAEGWAVVAIDLPGHGEAQGKGRAEIPAYAEDVKALIASLNPARLVLCGHSMGGGITQQIALDGDLNLAGIVLVATGAHFPLDPQLIDNCEQHWDLVAAGVPMAAVGPDSPEDVRHIVGERFAANDNMVVANDFRACRAFDVRGSIGNLTVPTCVITGSNDLVAAPNLGAFQDATIPGAQLHALHGPGHFLMQEAPDVTNHILVEFGRSLLKA